VSTTFVGGRFKNPFWEPIAALVDGDINLDGVSTTLGYKVNDSADLFLSYGFLTVLENSSDRGDRYLT
jgi:hypothetical protein